MRGISVDEWVACQLVVEKAPIFINSDLHCCSQDGISDVNYAGVTLFHTVVDRFSLWDLLCLGFSEYESRRWWFTLNIL